MSSKLRNLLSIFLCVALFLTSALIFTAVATDSYTIDDFEGYADTAALTGVWGLTNESASSAALSSESGKALAFSYTAWADVYRGVDFSVMPSDAAGLALKINSTSAVTNVSVKLGYNSGAEYRYVYELELKAGDNEVVLSFDDEAWTGAAGWGSIGAMKPLTNVKQLMISTGGGENTLVIDDIRFVADAGQDEDAYLINDFEGYADTAALESAWESADNSSLALDDTAAKAGKSLKITYSNWGNTYMKRLSDAFEAPADAAGIGMWVKSSAATSNLAIRLIYGTDEHRFKLPVTLTEGVNELKLDFADAGWERAGGWGSADAAFPGKTGITAIQFESAGGAYTLNVDDIRFLTASELEGGGSTTPTGPEETDPTTPTNPTKPEVPEEPTLPSDPYTMDDFEGYANSSSLGYGSLWQNNSGGACTATLTLENGAGNAQSGKSLKIHATDGGWMTITRNSVSIPLDATSMTFWAKADAEATLKLEFRLNNNDYKYAPASVIEIGTEGALYTVYFADVSYVPGSGGEDKGWSLNDKCLVNAINFSRDGYEEVTLYIDNIAFGKGEKPVDPDNPITLLETAISGLPAYDDLTVLDIDDIESLYETYSALSADEKKLVSNRQELLDAKELAELWTSTLGGKLDAVKELASDIADLPSEVTEADRETVEALWSVYNGLTDAQKALVPGSAALEAAYQSLNGGEPSATDGTEPTGNHSPETGAALPAGAGALALLAAGLIWAFRKKA